MRLLPLSLTASLLFSLACLFASGEGRSLSHLHNMCSQGTSGGEPPPAPPPPKLTVMSKQHPDPKYASISKELAHLRALNKAKTAGWFTKGRKHLLPTDISRLQREAQAEGQLAGLKRSIYKASNLVTGWNDPRAYEVQQVDRRHLRRPRAPAQPQSNNEKAVGKGENQARQGRPFYRRAFF